MIKKQSDQTDEDDDRGGQSGAIEFREFISSTESLRDDLPASKVKQLLKVHQEQHVDRVKKQKEERENRQILKESKNKNNQAGLRARSEGSRSAYRSHPVLSESPQFSGMDRQVTNLPTENIADTNQVQRERLSQEYRLRYAPQNAPRFNPKPNFP